jgi:hypothetical protein
MIKKLLAILRNRMFHKIPPQVPILKRMHSIYNPNPLSLRSVFISLSSAHTPLKRILPFRISGQKFLRIEVFYLLVYEAM